MKPVGYLINYPDRLEGERGIYFNYILASNGLFIEAENKYVSARVPVAECEVRGLMSVEPQFALHYGKIPAYFFDLALSELLKTPNKEQYIAVIYNHGYHLIIPGQENTNLRVKYDALQLADVVMDIHSHGEGKPFFSPTDNTDEQGLRLYAVIGNLSQLPTVLVRVGVYGSYNYLKWSDVFEGQMIGAIELDIKTPEEESLEEWESGFVARIERAKQIIKEKTDELHCKPEKHDAKPKNRRRWLWWNRFPGF